MNSKRMLWVCLFLLLLVFFPASTRADACAAYQTIPEPGVNEYPVMRDVIVGKLLSGIMFPQTDTKHSTYAKEVALLQGIMRTLEPHLPVHAHRWTYSFHTLEKRDGVDAKALPGGPVFVTTGTFLESPRVDLLAVVLAHEIGHVVLRHGTRFETVRKHNLATLKAVAERRDQATTPEEKALLEDEVTDAFIRFLDEDSVLLQHEIEADVFAAQVASRAGYDLEISARFHEQLAHRGEKLPEGSTHPPRLARAQILRCFAGNPRAPHDNLDMLLSEIRAEYARHMKRIRRPKAPW